MYKTTKKLYIISYILKWRDENYNITYISLSTPVMLHVDIGIVIF